MSSRTCESALGEIRVNAGRFPLYERAASGDFPDSGNRVRQQVSLSVDCQCNSLLDLNFFCGQPESSLNRVVSRLMLQSALKGASPNPRGVSQTMSHPPSLVNEVLRNVGVAMCISGAPLDTF